MKKLFACVAAAGMLLAGCGDKGGANYVTLNGFALGTTYKFTISMPDTTGLQQSIDSLFEGVNNSMSIYNPGSLLNRLNRNETDSLDRYIAYCIETAARVSELSGGEYDITLKPVVDAWGFNADERQHDPDIDSLMEFVGYRSIAIDGGRLVKEDPRTQIDLNSIAKGYTVDLLAELVEAYGAGDYLIEVGGEISARGVNAKGHPWRIGIDKPLDGNNVAGAVRQANIQLGTGALATSGNYRKFYIDDQGRKVVHTISGTTGMSRPGNLLSATIIADRCALADAYATMCMAVGLERAREFLKENDGRVNGYLVYSNDRGEFETYVSEGLQRKIVQ